QQGNFEAFRAEAERFVRRYPSNHNIVIADATGQQLLNSDIVPGLPLPPRKDSEGVKTVFATGRPFVSNVFIGSVLKRPIFTVEVPVEVNGRFLYDLSFNPPMRTFADMIDQDNIPRDWVVSIFDRHGQHVARRPALNTQDITQAAPSLKRQLDTSNE